MRGYEVPVTLYVAAEDEDEAYWRACQIADTMKGKHSHGHFIEDFPKMKLIPELGA